MKKVLLVEDSVSQAAKTRLDLETNGFKVEISYDGATALNKIGQWQPDIIVLDYLLPDIDGIEICRLLKQNPLYRAIPVVVYSIENKLRNMTQAYFAGADGYVIKGENDNVLEVFIENIISRKNRLRSA